MSDEGGVRLALQARRGTLITVEGVWGAGKTTLARLLGEHLAHAGFSTRVMHYGPRHGVIGRLSLLLEEAPLRSRTGIGGYGAEHHATVDVLLRLCREAYHHRQLFRPALEEHDVVILDHGVYSKLAYALAVMTETAPDDDPVKLLDQLRLIAAPWFLHPDRAVFLDIPWPLARERAIARRHGGGDPGSVERLLFLPRYDAAYRQVLALHPHRVRPVRIGRRAVDDVLTEVINATEELLHTPLNEGVAHA